MVLIPMYGIWNGTCGIGIETHGKSRNGVEISEIGIGIDLPELTLPATHSLQITLCLIRHFLYVEIDPGENSNI